jgi:hypothetical protein
VEVAVSRTERRNGFQDEHRIRLLESDVDDIAGGVADLRRDLTGAIDKLRMDSSTEIGELRNTLASIRNVLIGGLVMFATSSVLLGLNLAIGN